MRPTDRLGARARDPEELVKAIKDHKVPNTSQARLDWFKQDALRLARACRQFVDAAGGSTIYKVARNVHVSGYVRAWRIGYPLFKYIGVMVLGFRLEQHDFKKALIILKVYTAGDLALYMFGLHAMRRMLTLSKLKRLYQVAQLVNSMDQ
ncbi:hypothetical protein KFL_014290010 [Klebsormidium nitens]|uniref:Uncharacterized protein n=1 Tax=Klebsormidium nitens TaxID=105231 RepID=A0A1Y1IRI7_KLENI|nr:hypothetical protein KFL_014290010 [Klebsormidium nitens]|eukprot:GAQ93303.1 hypothetical protein KFL_014290010 [Klebsormidium nitens]